MIVGTVIGIFFGTGIVCSGVEIGLGVGITGCAQGIVHCRSFLVD